MSFCKMCGASLLSTGLLEAPPYRPRIGMPATSGAEVPAMVGCPSCGRPTQAGLAYCQVCGGRVVPRASPVPTSSPRLSLVPGNAPAPHGTVLDYVGSPPSGLRPSPAPALLFPAGTPISAGPSGRGGALPASVEARRDSFAAAVPESRPVSRPEPRPVAGSIPRGRLVLLGEGRDQEAHLITADPFDIGRTDGNLVISSDPLLAPRHARVLLLGGIIKLRPLDMVNGVFVRLREACELVPGDTLLLGHQVIRFEAVGPDERDPPALSQHGVRLLGSRVHEAWGRLRQLTTSGTARDIWHLTAPEVTIGGTGSDVVLGDDDDILPHHVLLHHAAGRTQVEDTGSSLGGTFLRLRGDRELRHGDLLRLGGQLVRFENAG